MPIILPPLDAQPRQGTLLELVRDVFGDLGLQPPPLVVGSTDPGIIQALALATKLGRDLVREFDWQELMRTSVILVSPGVTEYPLPQDWGRQIPGTEWTADQRWPALGPLSGRQWAASRFSYVNTGIDVRFRIVDNKIVLFNPPAAPDQFEFQYISRYWVVRADGVATDRFESDDDSFVFANDLMHEGLKVRWEKAKGLSYDEITYQDILSRAKGQNKGAPYLSTAPSLRSGLMSQRNVPDGNFPGP